MSGSNFTGWDAHRRHEVGADMLDLRKIETLEVQMDMFVLGVGPEPCRCSGSIGKRSRGTICTC